MEEKKELQDKELKEKELNKVAGGRSSATRYRCDDCYHIWNGTVGYTFYCPSCKSRNFHEDR